MDGALILALTIFAICEIGLRITVANASGQDSTVIGSIRDIRPHGLFPSPYIFSREVGYLYQPNYIGRYVRTDFDTALIMNEHGFHGPSFDKVKPDGVYRVALLGDSRLTAHQVAVEQTWAYLLNRHLSDINGRRIELLNFGVDGYNLWNIAKLLELKVAAYQPDVVVLWYDYVRMEAREERYRTTTPHGMILDGSDPDRLLAQAQSEDRAALSLRRLIPRTLLVSRLLNLECRKVEPANLRRIDTPSRKLHDPSDLLRGMKKLCADANVPFAVFYRQHTPQRNKDHCLVLGIPTWSDVGVVPDYATLQWPHDEHFDVAGNAVYAEKVAPVFQKMLQQLATKAVEAPM